MKSTARVVIIGGGIAGCSTLYHLTREGWTDVMLLERDELTSGTTWHSAAQVTNFGMSQTMIGLKSHSISLYKELRDDPDYPVGYNHGDGGIRLAGTDAQMDGYRHFVSVARGMGVEFEVIDARECARRHPLITTDRLKGGLWDPHDGHIDPAQLCAALVRQARAAGAEIHRNTPVTGLRRRTDDSWIVDTPQGSVDCEAVVNAGGYRCNEIAAMMGVHHPVVSMEHQYFVTEAIQRIVDADRRMPLLRCPVSDFYCRQERQGLLVGFYEQDCRTWGMDGIDPEFSKALCPDDLDRVSDVLDGAVARMPVLAETGIHTIVNGPITYSLDGTPLVGQVPGLRNAYCIIGLRAGLGEGGGHGWLLAQQIVHGEAVYDTWCLDPRRFTGYGNTELTALKAIEEYRNEFRFHFPHEHRPAGRPIRTTPLTPVIAAEGAKFAEVNGWERADYFSPSPDFEETLGFRFNETFDIVGEEVAAVQSRVGLTEVNGFNRMELSGPGALEFLDFMICGRIRRRPGTVGLGYMLNDQGMLKSEVTVAHLSEGRFWLGSAAAAEWHDRDWLLAHAPKGISLVSLTNDWTALVLAGPYSRNVMQAVSRGDWSAEAFPWLSVREAFIGIAPATVMSVSYSGELAYEIHVDNSQLHAAWRALREAGKPHGMKPFGARAVESMRLEKGYLHWKADILTEFDPFETDLDRFVDLGKEFLGKSALLQRKVAGPTKALVSLALDTRVAPAHSGATVAMDGQVTGTVTSGGWGYRTRLNLAYAFVEPRAARKGTELTVDLIGEQVRATVIGKCPYDPQARRLRG